MKIRTQGRPGRKPVAMKVRTLQAAALAGALGLAACGGGGGGSPAMPPDTGTPVAEPAAALVSGLRFDYTLRREGEPPIEEAGSVALSCPGGDCTTDDLRELSGDDGTGMRDGFGTVTGTTSGPALTEVFSGISATVSGASFTRYGFWAEHGFAAVTIGTGSLSVEASGQQWSGDFTTAHAWADGEVSGANPTGTGSATWRGLAEAVRITDFTHLPGSAELRIADLSRPRVDVDLDLDGAALRWTGMQPAGGSFAKGTAGSDRIDGRFYGPGHEEAWGVFDTGAYVGAFGAKRE